MNATLDALREQGVRRRKGLGALLRQGSARPRRSSLRCPVVDLWIGEIEALHRLDDRGGDDETRIPLVVGRDEYQARAWRAVARIACSYAFM
jgi:hypothetical protein